MVVYIYIFDECMVVYIYLLMNVWLLTFWSLVISETSRLFTSKNVVFQKTNEVFINDIHWFVICIHDLRSIGNLISKMKISDYILKRILISMNGQI